MTESARFPEKLVIVSHVVHYESEGKLYAYAPYAREIEIWADIFEHVTIAAPYRNEPPPSDCARFEHTNLRVIPQREIGGETLGAKIKLALATPAMAWELSRALREADAVHVRCPGNIGLLGALLAPMYSKKLVAKFAGQWSPRPNDPWSTKFQRRVLSSRWWHGPVTVYGNWPNQPKHVVPFFSSAVTRNQLGRARSAMATRTSTELRNILFVGRLSRAKNVDVLLEACAQLRAENIPFRVTIAGEGPESASLRKRSADLGLDDLVEFVGGVSSDGITDLLKRSGILVLVSETEGWPKAIVEAMAFGLVTIGSNVGLIPEIMSEGRGLTVPPRDVTALTATLRKALVAPETFSEMRLRAADWASHYSLESLRDSLRELLQKRWRLSVKPPFTSERVSAPKVPVSAGVKQ